MVCVRTILLVENDEAFRANLAEGIAAAGHRVVEAANGAEALARFEESGPDLIVTDIVMEEVEGTEFFLTIRKRAPDFPVIAMSGNELYLHNIADLGATRTLLKPFRMRVLLDCITEVLGASRE